MSAPVKITAIRHAVSELHGAADVGAVERRYANALQAAGEAIDEVLEAATQASALSVQSEAHMRLRCSLARLRALQP